MTRSIRRQVTLASLATTLGLLAALGVAVVIGVRLVLVRQLDRQLRTEAMLVASLAGFDVEKGVELDLGGLDDEGRDGALVEAWTDDGPLVRSESVGAAVLPRELAAGPDAQLGWADAPGAGRLRCVGIAFHPSVDVDEDETGLPGAGGLDGSPEVRLVLARSDDAISEVLSGLFLVLGACALVFGAGAVLLSRSVARSGLRPLREFAREIARLDDRSLSTRLDLGAAPDEVRPVGERLNELLDHLDATLERERALSADVAHELRTPLAGLRSTLEVALRGPREPEAIREALTDALAGANRLQALTDRLLWLVRLDAGTVDIEIQPVEIDALLEDIAGSLQDAAAGRGLRIERPAPTGASLRTDPLLAGIAFRNLLENAVAYADEGGSVRVRVEPRDDGAVVEIANSGSRVSPAAVPGLLRRFTRGDAARTPVGSRCGLGLPIVDRIANALGHRLEIRTAKGGDFVATLVLCSSAWPRPRSSSSHVGTVA